MTGTGRTPPRTAATKGRRPGAPAALWAVLAVGPAAWVLHLLLSYWFVPVSCERQHDWFLHGTTLVAASGALACLTLAARRLRRGGPLTMDGLDAASGSQGAAASTGGSILGALGVLLAAFFASIVLVGGLAPLLQSPCA